MQPAIKEHGESGAVSTVLCWVRMCEARVYGDVTPWRHSLQHTLIFISTASALHHSVYNLPEAGPTSCREDMSVGSRDRHRDDQHPGNWDSVTFTFVCRKPNHYATVCVGVRNFEFATNYDKWDLWKSTAVLKKKRNLKVITYGVWTTSGHAVAYLVNQYAPATTTE